MPVVWMTPTAVSFDEIAATGKTTASVLPLLKLEVDDAQSEFMNRVYAGINRAGRLLAELDRMRTSCADDDQVRAATIDAMVSISSVYLTCSRETDRERMITYLATNVPYLRAHAAAELSSGVVDGPASRMHAHVSSRLMLLGDFDASSAFESVDDIVIRAACLYELERRELAADPTRNLACAPAVTVPFNDIDGLFDENASQVTVDLEFLAEYTRWTFAKWMRVAA